MATTVTATIEHGERWAQTAKELPPKDAKVDWIAPNGDVVIGGTFAGGAAWYPPDSSMYVYYAPVFWRLH